MDKAVGPGENRKICYVKDTKRGPYEIICATNPSDATDRDYWVLTNVKEYTSSANAGLNDVYWNGDNGDKPPGYRENDPRYRGPYATIPDARDELDRLLEEDDDVICRAREERRIECRRVRADDRLTEARMSLPYTGVNLESYKAKTNSQQSALGAVTRYLGMFEYNRKHGLGFVLLGPEGSGKRTLASALAESLTEYAVCRYIRAIDVLRARKLDPQSLPDLIHPTRASNPGGRYSLDEFGQVTDFTILDCSGLIPPKGHSANAALAAFTAPEIIAFLASRASDYPGCPTLLIADCKRNDLEWYCGPAGLGALAGCGQTVVEMD